MKFYIVSILAFLLTFCSDNKTSEKNNSLKSDSLFLSKIKSDTLSAGDTTMSELIKQFLTTNQSQTSFIDDKNETGNMYSNSIQAAIFSNLTIVYSEPDTTSTQVALLKFNTPIKILTSKHGLFEIEFQSKKGFVKTKAVSTHTFTKASRTDSIKYFIMHYPIEYAKPEYLGAAVYKYDLNLKRFVDTFKIESAPFVKEINSTNWKNVHILLYVNKIGACCGCTTSQQYIIDANGNFETLFETSQSYSDGDDGAEWTSNVTLPLDPELSPIVYSEYQYGYIFDDSGNAIFNPDGSYKMKVQKNLRKYYKWDGLKLTLVSENNN